MDEELQSSSGKDNPTSEKKSSGIPLYKNTKALYSSFGIKVDRMNKKDKKKIRKIRQFIIKQCKSKKFLLNAPLKSYDEDYVARIVKTVHSAAVKQLGVTWPFKGIRAVMHRKCLDSVRNANRAHKKAKLAQDQSSDNSSSTESDSNNSLDNAQQSKNKKLGYAGQDGSSEPTAPKPPFRSQVG